LVVDSFIGVGPGVCSHGHGESWLRPGWNFDLGSVNGEKLDWQEFQKRNVFYPNSAGDVFGQRNYIWNFGGG
jgi:hypothetical protein